MDHIPFKSVKNAMSKARKDAMPKDPDTIQQINDLFETEMVRKSYGRALRSDTTNHVGFFRGAYETEDGAYCVFAAEDIIKDIRLNTEDIERKTIYADGTFQICPRGKFKQVLILFADLLGHVSIFYIGFI